MAEKDTEKMDREHVYQVKTADILQSLIDGLYVSGGCGLWANLAFLGRLDVLPEEYRSRLMRLAFLWKEHKSLKALSRIENHLWKALLYEEDDDETEDDT